ncbi:NTE family protein [Kutzneria viridogrisea]|uniref:NTE family protein n=1 Tax=Kutzneria viridogrisea TaxID=47990 RepID=A0ABR6BTU6_9PSEU|nr:NTE family protein [Kutzneria viridogrisea]
MTSRGLVIGAGGVLGAAWSVGALAALREHLDWDPRFARALVGTSAGGLLVSLLAAGVSVDELVAWQADGAQDSVRFEHGVATGGALPPVPYPVPGSLGLAARGLPWRRDRVAPMTALSGLLPRGRGDLSAFAEAIDAVVPVGQWAPHPAVWVVACDRVTGERVAFGAPGAPPAALRDAVRASYGVPGWFPATRICGRDYVDGGVASPTSADLVAPLGLDEVVVLSPMTSAEPGPARGAARVERLLRRAMNHRLDTEVAALERAGTRVVRLDPCAEDLAAMGPNLMDPRRRLATFQTARRTVAAALTGNEVVLR